MPLFFVGKRNNWGMCIKIPDKVYFIRDSKSSYIYINSIKFFCAVVNIKLATFFVKSILSKSILY